MKIRITKKGLPKAQYKLSQAGEELQLTPNQQPNYNWMQFNSNPISIPQQFTELPKIDMSAFMPSRFIKEEDITDDMRPPQEVVQAPTQQGINPAVLGIGPRMNDTEKEIQARYDSDPKFARNYDENLGFGVLTSYLKPNSQTSRKELRKYVDFYNNKYDTKLKMPLANPKLNKVANAVSAGIGALSLAGSAVDYFESEKKKKEWDRYFRQQMMASAPSTEFEGIENINSGRMFENMLPKPNQGMVAAEYGGSINNPESMKIRITSAPRMEYGGQSGYSLDLNRRKVYTDMPETRAESVSGSISAVPRDQANIEAEGGETVYGDLDGDGGMEHLKIEGPRHSNGGVPLNVPEGSFIFSDFAKMKIKDPEVLKYFGLPAKKGGYTPAEIAKRYDINKYKAIIEDENADEIDKTTAQIMVKNYQDKLGQLSMIQESMKDFPQGMPKVAQASMGQNQEEELTEAKYGGSLPRFQGTGNSQVPVQKKDAPVIYGQTLSPKQLADMSDADFQKYMDLLKQYDKKSVKGAYFLKDNLPEDVARELARLATKFGFSRKDKNGKSIFRVIQGSNPEYSFANPTKADANRRSGFFGGFTPQMYERRVVEDVLGTDAVKNMSELDIRKAYFKELGVDVSGMSDDQLKDAKSLYTNKDFFSSKFYPKFTTRFGQGDYRTMLGDDQKIGAEHYDSYRAKEKETKIESVPGFICLGLDDKGYPKFKESSHATAEARAAAGAYASKQEASLHCPGEPDKKRPPGDKPKEYPAKYWTPDNWALGAATLFPPKLLTPFVSDMQFRPGQLALEDWLSQAQNIQQAYNTSANTLGNYQPGTALASNLSFLQGTAGDQTGQVISQVGNRNVDRFNRDFMQPEMQRKQAIDAYNTAARDKRWDYMTTAKQNFTNANRKYVNGVVKAATNRFANRMYTDMLNKVNPIFNMDPTSGLSYFKQGWDWSKFGNNSASSGSYENFPELKNKYLKLGMSEANAEKEALAQIKGGRTTYTDSDMDGYPNSARMTAVNQMNYMNQLLPAYMSMMNIGRNAYSYNDE